MTLSGRVAIVTGAGSGIGRGIAQRFAREGALVAIADIDAPACARVASEIGAAAMPRPTDITSSQQVQEMIRDVAQHFGRLDILVNNAGRTYQAPVAEMPEEEWDAIINLNLRGSFLCCKYAAPYLIKSPCGRIINIVSIQGGVPFASAYCASKMGLMALTQSLMYELAPYNVTANAVFPGTVRTPLSAKAIELKAKWSGLRVEDVYEQIRETIPLKRFCTPEDVANVVAFLASDEASFVTGALYHVSGGLFNISVGSGRTPKEKPTATQTAGAKLG